VSRFELRNGDLVRIGSHDLIVRICDSFEAAKNAVELAAVLREDYRRGPTSDVATEKTGISTRECFLAAVRRAMSEYRLVVICFIQIDRAITIERVYGTSATDSIRAQIASILSFNLPPTITLVNVSNDEIALVATGGWASRDSEHLKKEVDALVPREIMVGADCVRFSVNVQVTDLDDAVLRISL
jgi:hypothetical protein